jgi:SPASM domain peptide maturase of grasp-with-spasm system
MRINLCQKSFIKTLNPMEHKPIYFKLFAHNIPVWGKDRSAIYDLQKGEIVFIPNILFQIIQDLKLKPLAEIKNQYAPNQPELFDNYIDFLIKKDLGFKTKSPDSFPEIDLSYDVPTGIYNAVIESNFDTYNIENVINSLDELLCRHLEMRLIINYLNEEMLVNFFKSMNDKSFRSIVVIVEYRTELWYNDWAIKIFESCQKIEQLIVVNCPIRFNPEQYVDKIIFTAQSIEEASVYKKRYIVNINYFTESLHYNPFHNRKVCIDMEGKIKNDLRDSHYWGNINEDNLSEVIDNEDFMSIWNASPDKIEGLKDSALRYCQFLPFQLLQNEHNTWFVVSQNTLQTAN